MSRLLVLIVMISFYPLLSAGKIKDIKSINISDIDSLLQQEERHVVIFLYTDWCTYCKAMQHTTFKDKEIANILKDKFWFATFNAESKETVILNNQKFGYLPYGNNVGVNSLAEALGTKEGKLAFPVLCILNSKFEIIFQNNQFISAKQLKIVLSEIVKKE